MTTPAAVLRPRVDPRAKRAAQVADRVIEDVIALGWPVGEVIGSEADLQERYQVSRAVWREAVRLLEHQQVARARRGPGGGLVITEPTIGAVVDAAVVYLHRVRASLDEISEASVVLQELAGHHNGALDLFVDVLDQAARLYGDVTEEGDRSEGQLLPATAVLAESGLGKGAEAVARHITRTIVAEELGPGDLVGTEPELIAREGVSRALLREAVRLLEHHHIARMRRGPGGGLFVMAPSADAVAHMAAIYLARRGTGLDELADMRLGVEVAVTALAADRIDPAGIAALHDALAHDDPTGLHDALAAVARNRALALVAGVLGRLHRPPGMKLQRQRRADVLHAHMEIAEAVEAGDRELACRRMRRHLEGTDR